ISMPGELGGANWGGAAADPTTGWVYVRSHDAPTMHILSERARVRIPEGAAPAQVGRSVYAQLCETCHGTQRNGVSFPKDLSLEAFRSLLRNGRDQMPSFSDSVLTPQYFDALTAYLKDPAAGEVPFVEAGRGRGGRGNFPAPPP